MDRRYFFFQAEDGIRDYKVTGVQTCALPIAPDLDLLVGTAQVFEFALCTPAHQIARAVQALARLAERVGNEALCRQPLPVEIAACQSFARHVQLDRKSVV